ncbi:hypothetical protein PQR02_08970 [Paraburkholderia sediminicola]|uniref:Uncharacterized protein n=1 Tax=Paraburkholderia rhynchosiae TaxID=487049 RepID=A0ACC7N6F6_9BURK
MTLNRQVQSFLAISEAFLRHTGDSSSNEDSREADEISVTADAHGEAVRECRDSLQ